MYLSRFDGQSRLLVRALMSGVSGAHVARSVFFKQRRANPETSLANFIETLCRDEVEAEPLSVVPLVCIFSPVFKQNLLTFIYLVRSYLPETSIISLLKCLGQDPHQSPWATALGRHLGRQLELQSGEPLYTLHCRQRLKDLSERLCETGGWAQCFSSQTEQTSSQTTQVSSRVGTQKKRRASFCHVDDDDEEPAQLSKRKKLDDEDKETDTDVKDETQKGCGMSVPVEASVSDGLPEHIRDSVLQIKDYLESQAEWDQNYRDAFQVLNECDHNQVEMLCDMLHLADVPEPTLSKVCSGILAVTPDLGYSTASALIRSLLVKKVLSMREPASRCLVTAVTLLCSRYPRPTCYSLIGPVLEDNMIGPPQTELLSRLIESSLDSHYRLLALQITISISWNEAVLSVIHCLLGSKLLLNGDVFAQFIEQLVGQSPRFIKSVKFAKMMLTVFTEYSSHVTSVQKHSLTSCLDMNETFLKKSLHAALKRIKDM